MVRPVDEISGIRSGLRVAGKEFGLCMYDGITGLITQPLQSAKAEGAPGILKGVGRGICGLLLKPSAGLWGIPACTSRGLYMEMRAYLNMDFSHYITQVRIAQGNDDWNASTPEERSEVIKQWHAL